MIVVQNAVGSHNHEQNGLGLVCTFQRDMNFYKLESTPIVRDFQQLVRTESPKEPTK